MQRQGVLSIASLTFCSNFLACAPCSRPRACLSNISLSILSRLGRLETLAIRWEARGKAHQAARMLSEVPSAVAAVATTRQRALGDKGPRLLRAERCQINKSVHRLAAL